MDVEIALGVGLHYLIRIVSLSGLLSGCQVKVSESGDAYTLLLRSLFQSILTPNTYAVSSSV